MPTDELYDLQLVVWDMQSKQGAWTGVCPHCGGLGYLSVDVPVGHRAFGRAFACICQRAETLRRRTARIFGDAADTIPTDALRFTFKDFEGLPYAAKAVDYARRLADGTLYEKTGKPGLMLPGPTGTGKTTLASIVFRTWAQDGQPVFWCIFTNLIKRIQRTYRDGYEGPDESEILTTVKRCPRMVIDDLGTPTQAARKDKLISENRIELIYQILDHREGQKLPTLVTTNLKVNEIYEQFGARVASRLDGLCHIVPMDGADFRARRAVAGKAAAKA